MQTKISKAGTSTQYEFFDSKKKTKLIYQYDAQNKLTFIEEWDALGILQVKTRFLPGRLWKQTGNTLEEWFTNARGRPTHRVTDLTGKKKTVEYFYEPNLNQVSCEKQLTSDLKPTQDLVKDLEPRLFDRLGKAKVKTSDCDTYPGGKKNLIKEMQEAINAGTECMAGTSPETKQEAMKLLAFYENPDTDVNIFCAKNDEVVKLSKKKTDKISSGTMARAIIPPAEKSPGMIFNVTDISKSSAQERKSTLFHEMLHWLGIYHSEAFDTPYLAESCCLAEDKSTPKSKKACDLLSKTPRPKITSKEYLSDFTDVMLLDYRSFIPMGVVKKNTAKKLQEQPVDLSAEFEANQKIKVYGNTSADAHAFVLKKLDGGLKDPPEYVKDESNYGQAAQITGELAATMYQKSTYEDFVKNADQVKAKYKELLANCKDDAEKTKLKESIHEWLDEYSLASFDVQDPPSGSGKVYAYKIWENLEKDL